MLSISISAADSAINPIVVGTVRVQLLSRTLIRIENRGPKGFEDRTTFNIVKRDWPGITCTLSKSDGEQLIGTTDFIVHVPEKATSLSGVSVTKSDGSPLWSYESLPANDRIRIPGIHEKTMAWSIADTPRIIPAPWGYNPAQKGSTDYASNGWDLSNNAPDIYLFLPKGDTGKLRNEFLELTGRTELVPLSALGYWDSRWYAYSERTALKQVDDYRSRGIPIDNLVVDTDWRVNASTGYGVNKTLFPDMARFIASAHEKNVSIMFNDHPEPKAGGLNPTEVTFRNEGLRGQFKNGLDIWWFDRNWSVALKPPSGINKETWGMYLYNWITRDNNPDRRPMIMANIDGIDNGKLNNPPSIAAHRYPIQWTGDIPPTMGSLENEIRNALYEGAYGLYPYTSSDIGGHTSNPTIDGYIRWMQYGALSPIFRPHCTKNLERMPWAWGELAESISRNFIRMRYRLLPLFYDLARNNYDTGEPILRRCDHYYPEFEAAKSDSQYMLGDGILVAPVFETPSNGDKVPSGWLRTPGGITGLKGEYFNNRNLSGRPILTVTEPDIDFDWRYDSPGRGVTTDDFSVRWTGSITIGSEDAFLQVTGDDGFKLYIDGKPVVDSWMDQAATDYKTAVGFSKGTTHSIKLEYYEHTGEAVCKLKWVPVSSGNPVSRSLWMPPGTWIDPWTGGTLTGPRFVPVDVPIDRMPIFVKAGSVIPLAPDMLYTGEKPWNPITLDIYPNMGGNGNARVYEDDTVSNDYRNGAYRTTRISSAMDLTGVTVSVKIGTAEGSFAGALKDRSWMIRLHKAPFGKNPQPSSVTVDGHDVGFKVIPRDAGAMPFETAGGSADGDVLLITIPEGPVSQAHTVSVRYGS